LLFPGPAPHKLNLNVFQNSEIVILSEAPHKLNLNVFQNSEIVILSEAPHRLIS
jgi:hypothetical protein